MSYPSRIGRLTRTLTRAAAVAAAGALMVAGLAALALASYCRDKKGYAPWFLVIMLLMFSIIISIRHLAYRGSVYAGDLPMTWLLLLTPHCWR